MYWRLSAGEKVTIKQVRQALQATGLAWFEVMEAEEKLVGGAKRHAKRVDEQYTAKVRSYYGDFLLQAAEIDDSIAKRVLLLRKQGVTDNDVRWWWNLTPFQRALLEGVDMLFRAWAMAAELKTGITEEEAAKRVKSCYPTYSRRPPESDDPDDFLPYELHDRVDKYFTPSVAASESEAQTIGRGFALIDLRRAEILSFSSMNAYIRNTISKGLL